MPLPLENAVSIKELRERCDRLERALMVIVESLEENGEVLRVASVRRLVEAAMCKDEDR